MLIGVIFMIAMLLVMILSGAISLQRTDIVFATESASAVYDGKPLSNHKWSISSGALKSGHRADVTVTGEQTSAGESDNTIQVRIYDIAGADVTSDYAIGYKLGTLKVSHKELTVKSLGATKTYDGTALTNPNYEISGLISGDKAMVAVTGVQTEVGSSPNTIDYIRIVNRIGEDVTSNYRITKNEQPLEVTSSSSQSSGGGSSGGGSTSNPEDLENVILYEVFSNITGRIYLKNRSYGDYTGNDFLEAVKYTALISNTYSASYLTSLALNAKGAETGEVTVRLVEMTEYALPYYMSTTPNTGYSIQQDDVEILGDAREYRVEFFTPNVTPAAHTSYLYRTYEREYRSFVHKNYLSIDEETLAYMSEVIAREGFKASDSKIIEKVAEFIQNSAEYDLEYDTALDSESNMAVAFLRDYKTGVCRHYATAATMLYRALGIPARYTIGAVADAKAGEWVEVSAMQYHAWVEVYIDGIGWEMVEVTGGGAGGGGGSGSGSGSSGGESGGEEPPEIKPDKPITPVTVEKLYDGTPLFATAELADFEKYAAAGYWYKDLVVSGSGTAVGYYESSIVSIVVYDKDGNDVTAQFEFKKGKIHVYGREITVTSAGGTFEYGDVDAQYITVSGEGLQYGHVCVPTFKVNYVAGKYPNRFSVEIKDANGNDVGALYKINIVNGELDVKPKAITIVAGSATKPYDGTPLTAENYTLEGTLVSGDRIASYVIEGSQKNIGKSDNIIYDVIIRNSAGEDVTKNYNINMQKGTLKVTSKNKG